jgi:hypothetical protein
MTASSPGLMIALIVEIIASVAPQVTVTFFSGSAWMPLYVAYLPAERVAERLGAPGDRVLVDVGRDRAAGGLLQGLGGREVRVALREVDRAVLAARRVISRMTLSVKRFALSATGERGMTTRLAELGRTRKG